MPFFPVVDGDAYQPRCRYRQGERCLGAAAAAWRPSRRRLPHPRKQTSAQLKQCHLTGRRSGRNPYHVDARRHDGNAPTPRTGTRSRQAGKARTGRAPSHADQPEKTAEGRRQSAVCAELQARQGVAGAVGVQATVKAAKAHAH